MSCCLLGPLMVITQKVTSLAFSLHDGLARHEDELTADQKYHVVR
jgi:lysophospholipid acyltransferase 1/2